MSLCPALTWFKGQGPAATSTAPVNPPPTLALYRPIRSSGGSATMVSLSPFWDMKSLHWTLQSHSTSETRICFVNTRFLIFFLSVLCLSGTLYPPTCLLHQALSCQQCREWQERGAGLACGSSGLQEVRHSLRGIKIQILVQMWSWCRNQV